MNPLEKIHVLDEIEKEIILCLQSAGLALQELSKEKSSQKNAETQTQQFTKSLSNVEMKLSEQINYLTQVSTGQPHEGSGYASAKVLQMAWHRISHVRSRVRELEETKAKYTHAARQQQQQRQQQHAAQQAAAAAQQQQQQMAQQQQQQQQSHQQDSGSAGGSNSNTGGGIMPQDVTMQQSGGN
ncbi:Mediator of RNA polymerase II transcription subunit 11 [Lucilia cuprina]|uniref:Mediator of RNA polymerase II transcription subunit 11 n=1 Tax=Lucilia cuprina TaxID=7375 RepID=A0A0L0BSD2_LUCCU|nr:Mediator of RNA polymerase II transcription subunit 11 [Lucilia cuprina]KNC22952.1 Mediator of RNA polymerase II transcription subunit 11 [Lucilia cuprina]